MSSNEAMKTVLADALARERANLRWKLEGLSERELRLPRTPTGFNLLGVLKHMAEVEIGYFGDTFDRPWPHPEELISDDHFAADPQADWYATEDESAADLLNFYARVEDFVGDTIAQLSLDATGRVPHWPDAHAEVTLGRIMVHVLVDLTRHLGQVDIVRESIDGAAGLSAVSPNLPDSQDWEAYTAKLTEIAKRF